MNRLDLPRTREEITLWKLSLPHIEFSLVMTTLESFPYLATSNGQNHIALEIMSWASTIQHEFPDLYTVETDPFIQTRHMITIANVPIHAYL
jgi:hypothetical protein